MRTPAQKNLLWRQAAIIGSIWAASEIVLGSFLHNIRLPFKGEILTAIGIAIMIAGHKLWPERGLLWRAGLICAAMKSISPSANLTGPMVAIAMEGFLADIGNRIFGQNNIGRLIGGGLAMTWAITHKLVNFLIAYGSDFTLAINKTLQWFITRFAFSSSFLGSLFSNIWALLLLALSLYFLMGCCASTLGIISANKNKINNKNPNIKAQDKNTKQFKYKPTKGYEKFSLPLLFIQLAGIVIIFYMGNKAALVPFLIVTVLYIAFCIYWYQRARKLILRWGVWLSIILASAIMGFILGKVSAGIYLAARAFIITFAFSAISTELTNPAIRRMMEQVFGSIFFDTLEYSFGALPSIIAAFPAPKDIWKAPLSALSKVISNAPYWLEAACPQVFLISGKQGSGKTTLMKNIALELQNMGLTIGGFYTEGTWKDGHRESFNIVRIDTGEKALFASRQANAHIMQCGPFYFYKAGFELGKKALSGPAIKDCQYIFMDEIGPLELENKGWAKSMDYICTKYDKKIVISVRESAVQEVKQKWHFENATIISAKTSAKDAIKLLI